MTRDEAIEIECTKLRRISIDGYYNSTVAAANIDALIELGLLKVDEPKSKRQQFLDELNRRGLFLEERAMMISIFDKVFEK